MGLFQISSQFILAHQANQVHVESNCNPSLTALVVNLGVGVARHERDK